MACWALWNTTSDESFHSDVLPDIDFMYSTKETEDKDAEHIFCKEKFSENERREIWMWWIKCFSFSVGTPGLYRKRDRGV